VKDLSIRPSPGRGRGVFAERDFAEGELIERCPALVFAAESRPAVKQTALDGYYYNWIPDSDILALALGYGSFYNHSWTANADWVCRVDLNVMDFTALRRIAAGEEILVNYKYVGARFPDWYDAGRPES